MHAVRSYFLIKRPLVLHSLVTVLVAAVLAKRRLGNSLSTWLYSMLNLLGWVTFYWHWKHLGIWQGNVSQFNESSTYLTGWFRDYLWLYSGPVIDGYNPFGVNNISVWNWMFLFGHLVWDTGFMFLISWRGYWQELIETLVWAHERTPLANQLRWKDKPVALSILQG